MIEKILLNKIYSLEQQLLKPEIRQSQEKIAKLLSGDFFEFTSSGTIWNYNKNDIIDQNIDLSDLDWEIKDFSIKSLTTDIILATYKLVKHDKEKFNRKHSLRSSIWQCINGDWKMIFHQGTPTQKL